MAEIKSYPNNVNEEIGAEHVMRWHHGRTCGVYGAPGELAVAQLATPAMAVTVSDGSGWLTDSNGNGIHFWNDVFSAILAGLDLAPEGYTGNLRAKFIATGKFKSCSDSSHIGSDKLARRGGIFLRDGHVLMALENGGSTETAAELAAVGQIVVDGVKQWCNVRSGPGLEYTILGRAKKDEVFVIYGVDKGWYRIGYNGSVGYIFGDLASEVLPGNV